jgi:DNA topoisomerase IB
MLHGETNGTGIVGGVTDPISAAKAASLRYVSDTAPGIIRRRNGKGFVYVSPGGKIIRDDCGRLAIEFSDSQT